MLVLLVEDSPTLLRLWARLVRGDGHQCYTALHDLDAVEHLRVLPIDLCVVDLELQGRLCGLDVIRACRELRPDCYPVLVSGRPPLERHGVTCLLKPIGLDDLRDLYAKVRLSREDTPVPTPRSPA